MNIQITNAKHMKYVRTIEPVSSKERVRTLQLAEAAIPEVEKMDVTKAYLKIQKGENPVSSKSSENDDDQSGNGETGRSPNDDRSDSMNPNNDSYQASMDNHSDQMNPNNDAYWSSRGR